MPSLLRDTVHHRVGKDGDEDEDGKLGEVFGRIEGSYGTKMYDLALLIAFLIISVVFVVWRVIFEVCFNKSTCGMWSARNKSLVNKGHNGRGKRCAFFKGRRLLIALVVTFVLSSVSSSEAARDLEVDGVRLKVCCIIHYLYHFDTH